MAEIKSQIDVSLCNDEDIPQCFQVMSNSFGHDALFLDAYFPDHDTEAGRELGCKRMLGWKQDSAESTFLKATIQTDGQGQQQIIGIAVWTHMKKPPSAELETLEDVEQFWPNEDDREYMKALWKEYVIPRGQAIADSKGEGVYVLELLAVHRDYQRRGAGSALVRWGTNKADTLGVKAVVEGTPEGRKTYENCGFSAEIEEMRFDVGERFAKRRKPILIFLKR